MQEHVANAKEIATRLDSDPRVDWVSYSGLPEHQHYERAKKYTPAGPGAVFSFGVKGGYEAAEKFINSVQLLSHLANIGDARSLIIHPASTTHQQLNDEQLAAAGVPADLIRISVGLEDVDDIWWDIDQALTSATGGK
jgi:O-acetylhomoserine (thiol)-lyase